MYSAGILNKKVVLLNRTALVDDGFGMQGGEYAPVGVVCANVTWSKGTRSLREGALEAYDTLLIRTRWHHKLTRDSRLEYDGKTYQIMSLNSDRQADEMQVVCQELQDNK